MNNIILPNIGKFNKNIYQSPLHGLIVYEYSVVYEYVLYEHGEKLEQIRYRKQTNSISNYMSKTYYCDFDVFGRKHGAETMYGLWIIHWDHGSMIGNIKCYRSLEVILESIFSLKN